MSEEMSGLRRGDRGRAPLFQGESLEVRVVRVVVWVDGRKGARCTAETGSSGQGFPFVGLSGAPRARQSGRLPRAGERQGGERASLGAPTPGVPAHEDPDLRNFVPKLLNIPAYGLEWL